MVEEGSEGSYYQVGIDFLIIAELIFFRGVSLNTYYCPT